MEKMLAGAFIVLIMVGNVSCNGDDDEIEDHFKYCADRANAMEVIPNPTRKATNKMVDFFSHMHKSHVSILHNKVQKKMTIM